MNIKQFFKITLSKVLLFFFLFTYSTAIIGNPQLGTECSACGCYNSWGYPLSFRYTSVVGANFFDPTKPFSCGRIIAINSIPSLILDIGIWFMVSLALSYITNLITDSLIRYQESNG